MKVELFPRTHPLFSLKFEYPIRNNGRVNREISLDDKFPTLVISVVFLGGRGGVVVVQNSS